jgi:hypothetical protein
MNIHDLLQSANLLQPRKAEIEGLGVVFFRRRTLVEQIAQDQQIAKYREAKKSGEDVQAATVLLSVVLEDLCDESGAPTCPGPDAVDVLAAKLPASVAIALIDAWKPAAEDDAKN